MTTASTGLLCWRGFHPQEWQLSSLHENFFKYMREEFLLDALVDYQIEPEDPTRTIPNPQRRALDKEIRAARADLANIEREFGAAAANNAEHRRPTMRGFKIAHGKLASSCATPART